MKDGGRAFPYPYTRSSFDDQLYGGSVGMTRRQWLAGLAMLGEIANGYKTCTEHCPISARAYELADAMLAYEEAERDKPTGD